MFGKKKKEAPAPAQAGSGLTLSAALSAGKPTVVQGPPPAAPAPSSGGLGLSAAPPAVKTVPVPVFTPDPKVAGLMIPLTPEESAYLQRKADLRKLTLGEYAKKRLFDNI